MKPTLRVSLLSQFLPSITSGKRSTAVALIFLGALYPLGFAPFGYWPLTLISVAGLLFIYCQQNHLSAFTTGFIWGLVMNLVGTSWVYVSIHRFGGAPWWGAGLLTLLFVAYLATFKGLFLWLCSRWIVKSNWLSWVLMVPTYWLFCEWLQSWLFTGFPWLLAGYSQMDGPFAALAAIGGVKWLSWMLLFIIALVVALVQFSNAKKIVVSLLAVTILASVSSRYLTVPSESYQTERLKVSLVQPNVEQSEKWDRRYFQRIVDDLYSLSENHWQSDILIWPEGAIPAYAQQVPKLMDDLNQRASDFGTTLVFGIPYFEADTRKSFVALKALGAEQHIYFKQVLVPFGEYVPLQDLLRGLIEFFDLPMSGFSLPNDPQQAIHNSQFDLLPAICYEIAYPDLLLDLYQTVADSKRPKIIITVSNDAWFGDSLGPYQHKEMARMRALELGLPLLRATNDGVTMVVDAGGHVLAELPRHKQRVLSWNLSTRSYRTWYSLFGELTLIVTLLSVIILNIVVYLLRNQRK